MKYKLSRQVLTKDVINLILRELREQKQSIGRVSKKNIQQIAEVSEVIKQRGIPNYLVCKKLPNGLGYGIFLHPKAKPILKGEVIAPYAGEISVTPENDSEDSDYAFAPLADILLTKKEQALIDHKRNWHPRRLYLLNVDAAKKGNFTRFINHSYKPNIVAELLRIPKNSYGVVPAPLEIIYFAKKTIRPGEQLLVSYEDGGESTYWGVLKIKPFPVTPKTFRLDDSLNLISK